MFSICKDKSLKLSWKVKVDVACLIANMLVNNDTFIY